MSPTKIAFLLAAISFPVAGLTEGVAPLDSMRNVVREDIYPAIGTKVNPVALIFSGEKFGVNGLSLLDKDAGAKGGHAVVSMITDMDESVRVGDRDKYIQFWDDAGRTTTRDLYASDPQLWDRYVELFHNNKERRLMLLIEYGDYVIAEIINKYQNGKLLPEFIALKRVANSYHRTNDLQNDSVFIYFRQIHGQKIIEQSKVGK